MRNIIVLILFAALFIVALIQEPVDDTVDALAGATNQTYGLTTIDSIAGATEEDEEDEEDEDEEDHD